MERPIPILLFAILFMGGATGARAQEWSRTFELQNWLGDDYAFSEQLVSYSISPPEGAVRRDNLKLVDENGRSRLFQLSEVETEQGYITKATVHFRTALPLRADNGFTLSASPDHDRFRPDPITVRSTRDGNVWIRTEQLQVKVPGGGIEPGRVSGGERPGPIMALSRTPGRTAATGQLVGPLQVEDLSGRLVERGPLFVRYQVTYDFHGSRTYRVVLTVRAEENFVTVDEHLEGFRSEDEKWFRLSYAPIDPTGRLATSNSGYAPHSGTDKMGPYDLGLKDDGQVPYSLGLYSFNMAGVTPATTFFRNGSESEDAIAFATYDHHRWDLQKKHAWTSYRAPENLYFYQNEGEEYMKAKLHGQERHWAVRLLPSDSVAIASDATGGGFYWNANDQFEGLPDRDVYGAGPGLRLFKRLTSFSLDWFKEQPFEWEEDVSARFGEFEALSFDEYVGQKGNNSNAYQDRRRYLENSWGRFAGGMGRGEEWLAEYANSRQNWTKEQRREVRSLAIQYINDKMLREEAMPSDVMMAGHPNFIVERKIPGMYAAVFPNHPDAPKWKAGYERMLDDYLDLYLRDPARRYNARGGRWTENIGTYSLAALRGLNDNLQGFLNYDGSTYTLEHPLFERWLRWHINVVMTPDTTWFWKPPQGAHARYRPYRHAEFRGLLKEVAETLEPVKPDLGAELLWTQTHGEEGKRPALQSTVFRDYGAILRYDYGGPDEAYVNLQQLGHADPREDWRLPSYDFPTDGLNYRWGYFEGQYGNGAVYYAANGTTWSWNGAEDNGDDWDLSRLPLFHAEGETLDFTPFSEVLYNFNYAQFVRTPEQSGRYQSRWVMMVRDDFLALYDDVKTESTRGTFQWRNITTGYHQRLYAEPNFSTLISEAVEHDDSWYDYDEVADLSAKLEVADDGFSFRRTGKIGLRHETTWLHLDLNEEAETEVTLWIDGEQVASGKGDRIISISPEEPGSLHSYRLEYQHHAGPFSMRLGYGATEEEARSQNIGRHQLRYDMGLPAIHAVTSGSGDQLHIIEPRREAEYSVQKRDWGAKVGEEYVFMTESPQTVDTGEVVFRGRTGYAQEGVLALFEGERVGYGAFAIESEGDFGLSARMENGTVKGRIAGREGGSARVSLPAEMQLKGKEVVIVYPDTEGGRVKRIRPEPAGDGAFSFPVDVRQHHGYLKWALVPAGAEAPPAPHDPVPPPAEK